MDTERVSEKFIAECFRLFYNHLQNNGYAGGLMLHIFHDNETCQILTAGKVQERYDAEVETRLKLEKKTSLYDYIMKEIPRQKIRESTRLIHLNTANIIRTYAPDISLEDISEHYLKELELSLLRAGYRINTVAKHLKVLKKYMNIAHKGGLITVWPFTDFTVRTEKTEKVALTIRELEKLEAYRSTLSERNEYLDAFLFSCYTGLRFSDVQTFSKQDVKSINGRKWIVKTMVKTSRPVRIPVSVIFAGKALDLIHEYKRQRGFMFRLPNNQTVNTHVRKICHIAGIRKVTFHCARHTCATLLLYKGVNLTTIQKILGHQSITTTQIYSAITDMTVYKEIKKANAIRKRK